MAAGGAQEHISSRVLMVPRGAALAGLAVQVGPKETGEAETQSSLLLALESAAPRSVLGRHYPCHSHTPSKALLPTS